LRRTLIIPAGIFIIGIAGVAAQGPDQPRPKNVATLAGVTKSGERTDSVEQRAAGLSDLGLALSGVTFAGTARAKEDPNSGEELRKLREEVDQLQKDLAELQGKNHDNADDIATLSRIDPPVGTVMAFAGAWPPRKTREVNWTERELGWLKCDGRSFAEIRQELRLNDGDLELIRLALNGDSIPDYQGYFLRGIDREVSDPHDRRDKDGKRAPGSPPQAHATARPSDPKSPFKTDSQGPWDLWSTGTNRQGAPSSSIS